MVTRVDSRRFAEVVTWGSERSRPKRMIERVPVVAALGRGEAVDRAAGPRESLGWWEPLFRVTPPGLAWRLAALGRSRGAELGGLVVLERGPGTLRLRSSDARAADRSWCVERETWLVHVVSRCGGRRVTL